MVSVPDDNGLDFTTSFTISTWVRPTSVGNWEHGSPQGTFRRSRLWTLCIRTIGRVQLSMSTWWNGHRCHRLYPVATQYMVALSGNVQWYSTRIVRQRPASGPSDREGLSCHLTISASNRATLYGESISTVALMKFDFSATRWQPQKISQLASGRAPVLPQRFSSFYYWC